MPLLGGCPRKAPKNTGDMCSNLRDGCKLCERILLSLPSQQLSILPSEQLVSQASSVKDVPCKITEQVESWNQCCTMQWAERVDIHTCETRSSGHQEALYWPINCLRSHLIASKFVWGSMPPDPPSCSMFTRALWNWQLQNLMATALACFGINSMDNVWYCPLPPWLHFRGQLVKIFTYLGCVNMFLN